jgi:transposase
MQRTVEMKLYLNAEQEATLAAWLHQCRWLYNQALEQRIKSCAERFLGASRPGETGSPPSATHFQDTTQSGASFPSSDRVTV